jgi:hypothetical protein
MAEARPRISSGRSSIVLLAKGEVGIEHRRPAPTLRDFAPRFQQAIAGQCAEKPRTVEFYTAKLNALLANDALASTRIDRIDEAAVEAFVQARSRSKSRRKQPLAPGSINRELATLRRLLRLAQEWKEIARGSAHPAAAWRAEPRLRPECRARSGVSRRVLCSASRYCHSAAGYLPTPRRGTQFGVATGQNCACEWREVRLPDGSLG